MCRIAWAEAYAALSRRAREMPEDAFVIEQAKMAFAADWSHFVVLALTNHWLSVRETTLIPMPYVATTVFNLQQLLRRVAFHNLLYSLLALIHG